MKYIIGITGYKQSGKDTAFKYLSQYLNPHIRIGFADSLKEEVAEILDVEVSKIESLKNHQLVRHILQYWGEEQKKQKGEHYWFNKVLDKIEKVKDKTFIFITDVRFPHEADGIINEDGCIVRVKRDGQVNEDTHESETMVDKLSYNFNVLHNDGTHKFEKECQYMVYNIKQFFKLI